MFEERFLRTIAGRRDAAVEIGKAAEHLVCADLIIQGYRAFLSDQALPYDLLVDVEGRVLRIQVKSTCFPRNLNQRGESIRLGYSFHVRRRGKFKQGRLDESHCDIVALVALDICAIAYISIGECGQTVQLMGPLHEFRGKFKRSWAVGIHMMPFSDAFARLP